MKKIRVFEAFSGYGSQSLALRNIGIPYEVVAISEIDKYAIQAYYALHDENIPNLGDISKIRVEDIPEHDLFTYSFPCQSISVSGRQEGIIRGQTRSGLLYECERIIENCKPKYLLMENVKNLVGKKFKSQFDEWLQYLERLGYTNYWQVLNAKDYGIPQNRERVFVISVLGEHNTYEFPNGFKLTKCIRDILDDEEGKIKQQLELRNDNITNTITTVQKDNVIVESKINQVEMLDIKGNEQIRRVYGDNPLSPTLSTMQGGNRQPKVLEVGYIKKSEDGKKHQSNTVYDSMSLSRTLTACDYKSPQMVVVDDNIKPSVRINYEREKYDIANSKKEIYQCKCNNGWQDNKVGIKVTPTIRANNNHTCVYNDFRIRKLTPKECFRLMGMSDDDIQKIIDVGISNTQQYKMAGNSIVIPVLEHIFKNLFKDSDYIKE